MHQLSESSEHHKNACTGATCLLARLCDVKRLMGSARIPGVDDLLAVDVASQNPFWWDLQQRRLARVCVLLGSAASRHSISCVLA